MSLSCVCPQEISAANHKIKNVTTWEDPEYKAIAAKVIEGEKCHYCGTHDATLAHHDEDWMYKTREAYRDPRNMTPACGGCHNQYRAGRVVCPTCLKDGEVHYMLRGADECYRHRIGLQARRRPRRPLKHPCGYNHGHQICMRDGRVFICGRSWKTAFGCDHFNQRGKAHAA